LGFGNEADDGPFLGTGNVCRERQEESGDEGRKGTAVSPGKSMRRSGHPTFSDKDRPRFLHSALHQR
jgi:hypothetical protein